jgi:hypothetical protein
LIHLWKFLFHLLKSPKYQTSDGLYAWCSVPCTKASKAVNPGTNRQNYSLDWQNFNLHIWTMPLISYCIKCRTYKERIWHKKEQELPWYVQLSQHQVSLGYVAAGTLHMQMGLPLLLPADNI